MHKQGRPVQTSPQVLFGFFMSQFFLQVTGEENGRLPKTKSSKQLWKIARLTMSRYRDAVCLWRIPEAVWANMWAMPLAYLALEAGARLDNWMMPGVRQRSHCPMVSQWSTGVHPGLGTNLIPPYPCTTRLLQICTFGKILMWGCNMLTVVVSAGLHCSLTWVEDNTELLGICAAFVTTKSFKGMQR